MGNSLVLGHGIAELSRMRHLRIEAGRHGDRRRICAIAVLLLSVAGGCAKPETSPVVFFLDGAGWYSSPGAVEHGLRRAGFKGTFETYSWSAYMGPAHDHLITARSKSVAKGLAKRLTAARRRDPKGRIDVMGLSAGTAVILGALERLPKGVAVDNVVLFSPSVSARHDLRRAMRHVRRNLYATTSRTDGILGAIAVNADGVPGRPAGIAGFVMPHDSKRTTVAAYGRVINLPWRPSYVAYDWDGGHIAVTNWRFVEAIIAPRLLTPKPYPLDRSIAELVTARRGGAS